MNKYIFYLIFLYGVFSVDAQQLILMDELNGHYGTIHDIDINHYGTVL